MFNVQELRKDWGSPEANALAEAVASVMSQQAFDLQRPITLRNHGSGPVFDIRQNGLSQHKLISASDADGKVLQLGFGAASRGITANEFVPDTNFALDPTLINEVFSTQGNTPAEADRSLLNEGRSGTGVPHTKQPYVPVAGWAEALTSLQKSSDTEHAPDSSVKLTRDGQKYWWCTDPAKWMLLRAVITAINTDTLTCNIVANGNVVAESVTVARNCYLQRSPWDGETIDGITYTYSDNQTREADDGVNPAETQAIAPKYYLDGSAYDPCGHIYVAWVGNESDVSNVGWIEVLPHRIWAAT